MAHGFDANAHLTVRWQWVPVPPLPRDQALPPVRYKNDATFLAVTPPESEMTTFRFSFPQLAKLTPDLRFYRLIQQFNTPLLSMTSREAAHAAFAYWRGESPTFRDDIRWAHFWFFRDATDQDDVVVEYGFAGDLTVHAAKKTTADLRHRYAEIVGAMAAGPIR